MTSGRLFSSGTIPQTSVPRNATANLHIGAYDTSDTVGWNGSIDEVRIYNSALTLAQVQELYAAAPSDMGPVISLTSTASGQIGQPFSLSATVTSATSPLSLAWSTAGGPGSAAFSSSTTASTNATCSLSASILCN